MNTSGHMETASVSRDKRYVIVHQLKASTANAMLFLIWQNPIWSVDVHERLCNAIYKPTEKTKSSHPRVRRVAHSLPEKAAAVHWRSSPRSRLPVWGTALPSASARSEPAPQAAREPA